MASESNTYINTTIHINKSILLNTKEHLCAYFTYQKQGTQTIMIKLPTELFTEVRVCLHQHKYVSETFIMISVYLFCI